MVFSRLSQDIFIAILLIFIIYNLLMSISEYAPIIIDCYNNTDKLKTLLESIQKNKEFHSIVQ